MLQKQEYEKSIVLKWLPSILLLPIVIYLIINNGKFIFIDYVNLLIHEGGHGIFSIFGKFIYTLGGTLTQIIIPGMFVVYYIIVKRKVLTQIFLVWLGQNLINISIYASDARTQRLPLLGGKKVYHDWTYLLNKTNLLEFDFLIGKIFFFTGVGVFIVALLIPIIMKDYKPVKINMDL